VDVSEEAVPAAWLSGGEDQTLDETLAGPLPKEKTGRELGVPADRPPPSTGRRPVTNGARERGG